MRKGVKDYLLNRVYCFFALFIFVNLFLLSLEILSLDILCNAFVA
jgi:hypothetical protein